MAVTGQAHAANNRGRLYWQCRRGMLELDLLLRGFLDQAYDSLDTGELHTLEVLLNYPDPVLFEWLLGRMVPFDKDVARLVQRIRNTTSI